MALLELGADDLVDVEEAVLLEADLDERGLHPGQDVVDAADVDVAGDRAALGPLEVDLGDLRVLEDRRRGARRRRRRRAARASLRGAEHGAAARGAGASTGRGDVPVAARARAVAAASPPSARPSPYARRVLPLWRARGGGRPGAGLLPSTPSAATAAALRLVRIGLFGVRGRRSRVFQSGARASPRARVSGTLVVGRLSSGNGTRARKSSFVGARAGYPDCPGARALVVNEKAWHGLVPG